VIDDSLGSTAVAARDDLQRDGFAIVRSYFTKAEVAELREAAQRLQSYVAHEIATGGKTPLVNKILSQDSPGVLAHLEILYPSLRHHRIFQSGIFRRSAELAAAITPGFTLSFDNLWVKMPHSQAVTIWHRDADFSPLRNIASALQDRLHFWVPLQRTDRTNGCLRYIAGSHLQPTLLTVDFSRIVHCELEEGDLLVHLSQTLHGSSINSTPRERSGYTMTFGRFGAHKLKARKLARRVPQLIDID
jgi:ectoine hydroxylase-related dioxygenase (phytanoyl-CoA dioxygenase family)